MGLGTTLPSTAPDAAPTGPSFDCARVSSNVNKLICASPKLSALDRKLADDFNATVNQGGVDGKTLRADEARWLRTQRNACADADCLARVYKARDAAILDISLKAASPAAYADTQPFPAPALSLAAARALVGRACGDAPGKALPGSRQIAGFQTIVARGAYVMPAEIGAARFAFLLTYPDQDFKRCVVSDVVALPRPRPGEAFLQCSLASDDSYGFGMRAAGGATLAYWTIDPGAKRLSRVAIHVIGAASLRCQQPEGGE